MTSNTNGPLVNHLYSVINSILTRLYARCVPCAVLCGHTHALYCAGIAGGYSVPTLCL